MSRPVIIHFHIFKNAGTTVEWILHKNFGDDAVRFDDKEKMGNIFTPDELSRHIKEHPSGKSFSSHQMRYHLPQDQDCIFFPIVFIRHPIDRAFSIYSFAKRDHREELYFHKAKTSTLRDFVRFNLEMKEFSDMKNFQTLWLSHIFGRNDLNTQALLRALTNLQSSPILGVVDKTDESLVVAEETLKPFFPSIDMSYISQNVSREREVAITNRLRAGKLEIGEELWAELVERNVYDFVLYSYASERLEESMKNIPDFSKKLATFKSRCMQLRNTKQKVLHATGAR